MVVGVRVGFQNSTEYVKDGVSGGTMSFLV